MAGCDDDVATDLAYWNDICKSEAAIDTLSDCESEDAFITEVSRRESVCVRLVCYTLWADALYEEHQTLASIAFIVETNITVSVVCPYHSGNVLQLWLCMPYSKLREVCSLQNVLHIHNRSLPDPICGKDFDRWREGVVQYLCTRYHQLKCHFVLLDQDNLLYDTESRAVKQCSPMDSAGVPVCAASVYDEFARISDGIGHAQNGASAIIAELIRGERSIVPLLVYQYIKQQVITRSLHIPICGLPCVSSVELVKMSQEWTLLLNGGSIKSVFSMQKDVRPFPDVTRSFSTSAEQIQKTLGLEATLNLFRMVSDGTNKNMLDVMLSQLSRNGHDWEGVSRSSVIDSLKGGIAKMAYECPTNFVRHSAVHDHDDQFESVLSNIIFGNGHPLVALWQCGCPLKYLSGVERFHCGSKSNT